MSMQGTTGGAPSGAATQQAQGQSGAGDQGQQQGQPQGQGQGQSLSDLGTGFLGRVPPEHQSILEPYVKQWDAGVTRRFQDLHGQLQPYQELGADPETLSSALALYQMVEEQPQEALRLLQEALQETGLQLPGQQQPGQQNLPQQQPGQLAPGAEGAATIPPEVKAQLDTMSQVLEALSSQFLEQKSAQEQAQEDAALDDQLNLLREEFGDFNERYVLAEMMAGATPEEAVQSWQETVQGSVNQRAMPPVPPILGGGGAVPQQQQSIAKAGRNDVKSLVANIMAQANQQ